MLEFRAHGKLPSWFICPKNEISNFELLVPSKGYIFLRNTRLLRVGKQYAKMLEEYDTWSQAYSNFEIRATYVCCSIERVADTLIKQLPREKDQASSYYSTAVEYWTITDRLAEIGRMSIERQYYLASFSRATQVL